MDLMNNVDLVKLDSSNAILFLDDEVNSIIQHYPMDYLISYEFKNKFLMGKVWNRLIKDPYIIEVPQGKLYKYLISPSFNKVPEFTMEELKKFWSLPKVLPWKLLELLKIDTKPKEDGIRYRLDFYKNLYLDLIKYSECDSLKNYIGSIRSEYEFYDRKCWIEEEENRIKKGIEAHKFNLSTYSNLVIINTLLILSGYKEVKSDKSGTCCYLYQIKLLDYLLWLSTGFLLTDIISDIYRYTKVKDEIKCKVNPEFLSISDPSYDYENYGLSNPKLKEYYLSECIKIGRSNGRLPDMYPGYSLATLRSSTKLVSNPDPTPMISDYEALNFIEFNIESVMEWSEIEPYYKWMTKYGIKPNLLDGGNGYHGLSVDNNFLPQINKILSKYDKTEFTNIRRVIIGQFDDSLNLTPLNKDELINFDNNLACQMIDSLIELTEIKSTQLLQDMKWLRLIGHINLTLRKSSRGTYNIFFNSVDFNKASQLIYKSESGYNTALKLINKLGNSNPFYKRVGETFNESYWLVQICNCKNYLGN